MVLIMNPSRNIVKFVVQLMPKRFQHGKVKVATTSTVDDEDSFQVMLKKRRNQACNSVLVEVANLGSSSDLHSVCQRFGQIKHMFHYSLKGKQCARKEMILVEYESGCGVTKTLECSKMSSFENSIPVGLPVLWLCSASSPENMQSSPKLETSAADYHLQEQICLEEDEIAFQLLRCSNVSEQIVKQYECERLSEVSCRLRFFACRLIERALHGLFPHARALPFGSSVNGFGRNNCDLDMLLQLSTTDEADVTVEKEESRLVLQSKQFLDQQNQRFCLQRKMEVIADILENFFPGCSQVRKILAARVPIIKYHEDFTGIDCDLSMSYDRSGLQMSELLYMYGVCDVRVRPLVFAVRNWARQRHITANSAGRWITNFSLTLLVIHYLKTTTPPVVPVFTVNHWKDGCLNGANTGISSTTTYQLPINTQTLEDLLLGFFSFYDTFPFRENVISLTSADVFMKQPPNSATAIFIQNPLQPELNVSRNVTLEELEKFQAELTKARFRMQCNNTVPLMENENKEWGLTSLLHDAPKPKMTRFSSFRGPATTLINWQQMFQKEQQLIIDSKKQAPNK